jgi:hypothetical protein
MDLFNHHVPPILNLMDGKMINTFPFMSAGARYVATQFDGMVSSVLQKMVRPVLHHYVQPPVGLQPGMMALWLFARLGATETERFVGIFYLRIVCASR